jgi:hypothetical protein
LFPCKPDKGNRRQNLAGKVVNMHMLGCEAKDVLFAVSYVELDPGVAVKAVQVKWQANMLENMQASESTSRTYSIRGADTQREALKLSAQGRRPDGRPVAAQAVWFSRGPRLYHAAIYSERISAEISESFFSGLEFE